MRYPTITVPKAHELIVQHHARIRHQTAVEEYTASNCALELRRRMLLVVTVPPHEQGEEYVFNLQLDHDQLHPLRQEWLREAQKFTGDIRARVQKALDSTGTDVSLGMIVQGLGAYFFPSTKPVYRRNIGMRRLLEAENDAAIKDYLGVTAEAFSGQINGRNPETGLVWYDEERLAYNAHLAANRIAELERRFRSGAPLRDGSAET
ncbi:MAG TPA: hypothetical protein PKV72_05705 [Candidatus Peribacteria bacterium]|nr:hypothetical protein [Candidatus Peribacteria bacterium]